MLKKHLTGNHILYFFDFYSKVHCGLLNVKVLKALFMMKYKTCYNLIIA
jgi:hypothetical protein